MEQFAVSYPEVQADSLREVVEAALEWLAPKYQDDLMVDDSGLFISALKGFPGVYSSYVYRTLGCPGVLRLMAGIKDRGATFRSCIGFVLGGERVVVEGECHGSIALQARGKEGFGFDPIFIPDGTIKTFAEMDLEEKNAISHRGRAASELLRRLKEGDS